MIFHQFQRYKITQQLIDAQRNEVSHSILELGAGNHANLEKFLPNDNIVYLDIELSEQNLTKTNFILGDATSLEYDAESFDFVIALDLIEHIPDDKRLDTIKDIARVAKMGFVISLPCGHPENLSNEKFLGVIIESAGIEVPQWLYEHQLQGIPDTDFLLETIREELDHDADYIFHADRELMFRMLALEMIASRDQSIYKFFENLSEFYNNHVFYNDLIGDKEKATKVYIFYNSDSQFQIKASNDIRLTLSENNETIRQAISKIDFFLSALTNIRLGSQANVLIKEPLEEAEELPGIRLSILLVTYNHSTFIAQALESIKMQKVDFRFRVVVADDSSTDNTLELIREFEANLTIPFVFLDSSVNHGITKNYQRAFNACDTEFIAVLEGDDFWTDPYKLQKHVDFLDNHKECSMSFNRYVVANYEKCEYVVQPTWYPEGGYQYITSRDLARDNLIGNFSTCVYRRSALETIRPELFDLTVYDWMTNIMIGFTGLIGFIGDVMSVYRIHSGGQWSSAEELEKTKGTIEAIDIYDQFTEYILHEEFEGLKENLRSRLFSIRGAKILGGVPKKNKIRILTKKLAAFSPPIFKMFVKLLVPDIIINKLRLK